MSKLRILFIALMVIPSFGLWGQADQKAIEARLDQFIRYSNEKNWDKAFDLMYPKLFTKVSKQELLDIMQGMEADGMEIQVNNARITAMSEPVKEGAETFTRLTYASDIVVQIRKDGIYDAPKPIQAIEQQFKAVYGAENVQWKAEEKKYYIRAAKSMMAIDIGHGDWRLIEINEDQPALMEYLFSPEILDKVVRAK